MPTDTRIHSLAEEVTRLRQTHRSSDGHLQGLMLKVTEIQLNLATQDKTLAKLDSAVNGNGRPGLLNRVDRIERVIGVLTKLTWMLVAAAAATVVKWMAGT